ncbi:MAG: ribose-phosphate diphosphokinase [Thermoprotei archaeon]
MIICGPSSILLGTEITQILGQKRILFSTKTFPDGETYVRLDQPVKGEEVTVVNTLFPDQDKRIVETLLMVDSLVRNGAKKVNVVAPYLAYARQDKVFREGEPVAPKVLGAALRCAGVDTLVVVEAHSREALEALNLPYVNVQIDRRMADAILSLTGRPQLVVAPDVRAAERAGKVADVLNAELMIFSKSRDRSNGEVTSEPVSEVNISEKTAVIVDDIISTGRSVASAAEYLKKGGVKTIYAVCVHALMLGESEIRIKQAGVTEIFGSNTIENRFARFSVASEVASAIKQLS